MRRAGFAISGGSIGGRLAVVFLTGAGVV